MPVLSWLHCTVFCAFLPASVAEPLCPVTSYSVSLPLPTRVQITACEREESCGRSGGATLNSDVQVVKAHRFAKLPLQLSRPH